MKKRLVYYEIATYVRHKNALVITGMRQVGKTTLLRQIYEDLGPKPKLWFDFENPLEQKVFESPDYRNIYENLLSNAGSGRKPPVVFIDEIQNFPPITKVIKYLLDHYGVKFIVTGSSSYYLKNLFPESLSGRKFLFELPPLSFQEYLYFKDALTLEAALKPNLLRALQRKTIIDFESRRPAYEDYLRFGGFPGVVTARLSREKKLALKNILASFFEKDIKLLSDYRDVRELRDLILLLVPRVGSQLEVSKLASELGVDRPKIYSYLEFLQGTFFIRLLSKFSRSVDRSVAGGRKVYFTDTGLLSVLGNVNDAQLFENAAINQLAQYGSVHFYNLKNTAEIDAILEKKTAFEIKLNGTKQDIHRARKLAGKLKLRRAYVLSRNFKDIPGLAFPMFL